MYLARLIFLLLLASTPLLAQGDLRSELESAKKSGNFSIVEPKIIDNAIKDPSDPNRIELLGLLRFYQNRHEQAASLFRRVISLAPERALSRVLLIDTLIEVDKTDEAGELFDSSKISSTDSWEQVSRLAAAGVRLDKCVRVLELLGRESSPLRDGELAIRFDCARRTGDNKAISKYELIARTSDDVDSVLTVMSSLYLMENFDAVIRISQKAKPSVASRQVFLELLALAQYRSGAVNDSVRTAAVLRERYSASNTLRLLEGALAVSKGDEKSALKSLEAYLQVEPESVFGLETYLFVLIKTQNSKKGLAASERLIRLTPMKPQALYFRGALLLQANKLDEAEATLRKLLEISPKHSRGCLALGLVYSAIPSRFGDAQAQMERCIEIDPRSFEAYYQLGLSYRTEGKNVEAIKYITKAVEIKPDYSAANRDLGKLHLQNGDNTNALKFLTTALSQSEADSETHFQLSRLYNLTGKKELARKHFQRFRELRKEKESGM